MIERPLKIAITANFVATEIRDSLTVWLETLGIRANLVFGPHDSIIQELLSPAGVFADADLAVILFQIERWCSRKQTHSASTMENLDVFIRSIQSANARPRPPAFLIVSCPCPPEALDPNSVVLLEERLQQPFRALSDLEFISTRQLNSYYPVADYREYFVDGTSYVEDMPYTPLAFATLGTLVARQIYKRFKGGRKVIVVDCDNTLWSGTCSESGPLGVRIGSGNRELQEVLVQQSKRGQLVCLCSKNDERDVFAVFDQHSGMLLKREHITEHRINWNSKAANLESLSATLQLSSDSFIFLDDDVFECESVRALCPEVLTIQVPNDQAEFSGMLRQIWDFDDTTPTREDEQRALFYRQDAERSARGAMLSLDDFLASLDLRVDIMPLQPENLPRAVQLMQRVNRFSLNGISLSPAELRASMSSGTCYTLRAADRFGDYGLVGVMVYDISREAVRVHSLALSCRALGRGIERSVAVHLANAACSSTACQVEFEFRATTRNEPVRAFIVGLGADEVHGRTVISAEKLCKVLALGVHKG